MITSAKLRKINFSIGNRAIPYFLSENCLEDFVPIIQNLKPDKVFIITDDTISSFYKGKVLGVLNTHFQCEWITIPAGEQEKNMSTIVELCSKVLATKCTRQSVIVPFGGGVIGNIAGFVASMLFRGIRFVHLPTTLLSMHDSVTSVKQAVNHLDIKNILGAFYYPEAIFCDVSFLQTLSKAHFQSGKAELVKNALIFGGEQYEIIKGIINKTDGDDLIQLVELGALAKGSLLCNDPYEKKEALIFEYGHTLGHAVELYHEGRVTHGEAVAIGMIYAGQIAFEMGIMTASTLEKHQRLIYTLYPEFSVGAPNIADIISLAMNDNKRGYISSLEDEIPMILLSGIGKISASEEHRHLTRVPISLIKRVLSNF